MMGCVFGRPDLENNPRIFHVWNVDGDGHPLRPCRLEVTGSQLILRQGGDLTVRWPLTALRRYGFDAHLFSFECGRRCATGAGVYAFRCRRAQQLFQLLQEAISRGVVSPAGPQPANQEEEMPVPEPPPIPPPPTGSPPEDESGYLEPIAAHLHCPATSGTTSPGGYVSIKKQNCNCATRHYANSEVLEAIIHPGAGSRCVLERQKSSSVCQHCRHSCNHVLDNSKRANGQVPEDRDGSTNRNVECPRCINCQMSEQSRCSNLEDVQNGNSQEVGLSTNANSQISDHSKCPSCHVVGHTRCSNCQILDNCRRTSVKGIENTFKAKGHGTDFPNNMCIVHQYVNSSVMIDSGLQCSPAVESAYVNSPLHCVNGAGHCLNTPGHYVNCPSSCTQLPNCVNCVDFNTNYAKLDDLLKQEQQSAKQHFYVNIKPESNQSSNTTKCVSGRSSPAEDIGSPSSDPIPEEPVAGNCSREESQVNYAVLDLDHTEVPVSASNSIHSLANSPVKSPEGYAQIDFDKTVALSHSTCPCPAFSDDSIRKTRHNAATPCTSMSA